MAELNKIQMTYFLAKQSYDEAFKKEEWEKVDTLENALIDAEFDLIEWTFAEVIKTGKMTKEDTEFMRKNANDQQWDKLIELGMRLQA